jgi:hypothetical protein
VAAGSFATAGETSEQTEKMPSTPNSPTTLGIDRHLLAAFRSPWLGMAVVLKRVMKTIIGPLHFAL